jgi:hypothetical protein
VINISKFAIIINKINTVFFYSVYVTLLCSCLGLLNRNKGGARRAIAEVKQPS